MTLLPCSLSLIGSLLNNKETCGMMTIMIGLDDDIIEWYEGHLKRKAQKVKIKDELMPIAWHPSRWWDRCIPEDEKKETEKLFFLTI